MMAIIIKAISLKFFYGILLAHKFQVSLTLSRQFNFPDSLFVCLVKAQHLEVSLLSGVYISAEMWNIYDTWLKLWLFLHAQVSVNKSKTMQNKVYAGSGRDGLQEVGSARPENWFIKWWGEGNANKTNYAFN